MTDVRVGDVWTGISGGVDRWNELTVVHVEGTVVEFVEQGRKCWTGIGAFTSVGALLERGGRRLRENPGRPCCWEDSPGGYRCHLPDGHDGSHDMAPPEITTCWVILEGIGRCGFAEGHLGDHGGWWWLSQKGPPT